MKFIIGLVVVLGCVLGGFMLHHGNPMLLLVPTEYLIILGCLFGGMIIKNPVSVLKALMRQLVGLLKGGGPGRKHYLEALLMIYELMQLARKDGVLALEGHVNEPHDETRRQPTSHNKSVREEAARVSDLTGCVNI